MVDGRVSSYKKDTHNHGVATDDVHSVAMSSRLDAIRSVYGVSVARNLIKVDASYSNPSSSVFEMDGLISDSNYSAKKTTMVLFINEPTFIVTLFAERLFECSALKRAIEIVYAATLPKASKLFIYMSIGLPPDHVDVNVHTTKTGTQRNGRIRSKVALHQLVEPAIVHPPLISWHLRGITRTVEMMINDLLEEAGRITGVSTGESNIHQDLSSNELKRLFKFCKNIFTRANYMQRLKL
nr:DNA mismatch repair protein MLH1 isoform X3 [Tanacetum cinerariifolium]